MNDALTGLELRSTATSGDRMEITLVEATHGPPAPDEVVIRVEAAPLNPSDLALLLGPVDVATLCAEGTAGRPALGGDIPAWGRASVRTRLDQSLPVGNEGAGTVVAAGADAAHLLGRRVATWGGAMYAQYRTAKLHDCIVLPEGARAAEGASMFVNPLTALGFVETMRMDGHSAIVHYAAASNLGHMLDRICRKDGIPLVNIVRRAEQVEALRAGGAEIVLDSSAPDFEAQLVEAVAATGATLAFDPIGGGRQAAQALAAMETVAARGLTGHTRYGSDVYKQVYIYGGLDLSPTVLDRWVGFSWGVGGWLLMPFLRRLGAAGIERLKQRVADELTTTFASHYTATISLGDVLDPDTARAYQRKATGEKYLIDPSA